MKLRHQVMGGVRWVAVGQAFVAVTGLLQVALLGRLLEHGDFGLAAVALAAVGFVQLFADLGVSNSIIFRQDTSSRQRSSLYWMNVLVGVFLSLAMFWTAPAIADFAGMPSAATALRTLSPIFLITALGAQFRVLHQRDLHFGLLVRIDMVAALLGLISGAGAAVAGMGVQALMIAALVSAAITTIGNLAWGWHHYRPDLVVDLGDVRGHLGFGAFRMGENTLNYVNSQIDVFLIGRLLGPEALGVYAMARNLCMKPMTMLNPLFNEIGFPVMAKLQKDRAAIKRSYLKGLRLLTTLNAPIHFLMLLGAEPIVLGLLGPTWGAAVPVVRILAAYWLIRAMGSPVGALLLATGRVTAAFLWNGAQLLLVPPLILMGILFMGLSGAASALAAAHMLLLMPLWFFLVHPACGAQLREFFGALVTPLLFGLMVALPAAWIAQSMPFPWLAIVVLVVVSLVIGVALLKRLDAEAWSELREVFGG